MEFYNTEITEEAIRIVEETLRSTYISEGKMAKRFEKALEDEFNIRNNILVNSGTSALHLAVRALRLKEGDEIILPAQTFIATGLVILYERCKPVFADIEKETGNISVESIKTKITDKTKAIICVHWGGYPCDMDEINELGREKNIAIIEDAAHAFGATYKEKSIGNISDFTCFSFQAIKILTTGDGGCVSCKRTEDYDYLNKLKWSGIDRVSAHESILGEREYNLTDPGYKYHMNDLSAALGLGNMTKVRENIKKRKRITEAYNEEFKKIDGIELLQHRDDRTSSHWLYTFRVKRRLDFIKAMKANNIPVSVVHLGIDKNDLLGGKDFSLVDQRIFDEEQIAVPVHSGLTDEDVTNILAAVKKGW